MKQLVLFFALTCSLGYSMEQPYKIGEPIVLELEPEPSTSSSEKKYDKAKKPDPEATKEVSLQHGSLIFRPDSVELTPSGSQKVSGAFIFEASKEPDESKIPAGITLNLDHLPKTNFDDQDLRHLAKEALKTMFGEEHKLKHLESLLESHLARKLKKIHESPRHEKKEKLKKELENLCQVSARRKKTITKESDSDDSTPTDSQIYEGIGKLVHSAIKKREAQLGFQRKLLTGGLAVLGTVTTALFTVWLQCNTK